VKNMAQKTVQIDVRAKKVRAISNAAIKLGRSAKIYLEMLRNLNKTVPKEARTTTAKYAAILRKALNGKEYDPVELANLLVDMKKEWRSWKAEKSEEIKLVREAAKAYFKDLKVLIDLTESETQQ